MPKSAFDIIPTICNKGYSRGMILDHLKLQKLLFYVQAWNLVFRGEAMFEETIQAWVHGPVVPSVYQEFKSYRYSNIVFPIYSSNLTVEDDQIVELIIETYGKKTSRYLEELSHHETPWLEARKGLTPTERSNNPISLNTMRDYYANFMLTKKPPSISPKAVEIPKEPRINKTIAFLSGVGSILEIMPQVSEVIELDYTHNNLLINENIQSYWSTVSSYYEDTVVNLPNE